LDSCAKYSKEIPERSADPAAMLGTPTVLRSQWRYLARFARGCRNRYWASGPRRRWCHRCRGTGRSGNADVRVPCRGIGQDADDHHVAVRSTHARVRELPTGRRLWSATRHHSEGGRKPLSRVRPGGDPRHGALRHQCSRHWRWNYGRPNHSVDGRVKGAQSAGSLHPIRTGTGLQASTGPAKYQ
jgi:hypothetical protein